MNTDAADDNDFLEEGPPQLEPQFAGSSDATPNTSVRLPPPERGANATQLNQPNVRLKQSRLDEN